MEEEDDERPVLESGEVVCVPAEAIAAAAPAFYRVEDLIGEGRCCLVYSVHAVSDGSRAALKCYRRGRTYHGAVKREQHILDLLSRDPRANVVANHASFVFKGMHCQLMELLDANVRQVIFRNERRGLSPWSVHKFARDILTALDALHSNGFAHGDLKPANVMWSASDGCFKLLDFGLAFHKDEEELHQIQTKGYQAPEVEKWNQYKDDLKRGRKRKLRGTLGDLMSVITGGDKQEQQQQQQQQDTNNPPLKAGDRDEWPSESSGIFTASEMSQASPPAAAAQNSNATNATAAASCLSSGKPQRGQISTFSDETRGGGGSTSDLSSVAADELTPVAAAAPPPPASNRHSTIVEGKVLELDSNGAAAVEGNGGTAEWRRGGRPRRQLRGSASASCYSSEVFRQQQQHFESSRPPLRPDAKSDIWSFGCLLFEVLTGTKLFSSGASLGSGKSKASSDRLASVLAPYQLVEMRSGEAEAWFSERGEQRAFAEAKALVVRCLAEEPRRRPAAAEALRGKYLQRGDFKPETRDMMVLPTSVVMLMDLMAKRGGKEANEEEEEALLDEIRSEASRFGAVTSVELRPPHVFVEFAEEASRARRGLQEEVAAFGKRPVVALFYPPCLFREGRSDFVASPR